jgi:hypothetical protein
MPAKKCTQYPIRQEKNEITDIPHYRSLPLTGDARVSTSVSGLKSVFFCSV